MFSTICRAVLLISAGAIVAACASIEGTRDKSSTLTRASTLGAIDTVAVLPIGQYAGFEGLSDQIQAQLPQSLMEKLHPLRVVDADSFTTSLAKADLVRTYGAWISNYQATSMIDQEPAVAISKAAAVHYLLYVPSLYLNREKISAGDTGYAGMSSGSKVWRTDLRASAVLIDVQNASVVWRGTAHAENITAKQKDVDLGLIIFNRKNPEVADYIGQLVHTLADGLAGQIAGGYAPNN